MIILDTTVIIDLWRGYSGVRKCLKKNIEEKLCISAITVEEIYDGLGYTKEKKGITIYKKFKQQYTKILNDYEIIPINLKILEQSGVIKGQLRAKGITLDVGDCIIGASAEVIKAKKIITRNPKHFIMFKVPVESYEIE